MYKLDKNRYEILLPYVQAVPFNMLMARSVIVQHVDGRIFVDSLDCPRTFYIVHSYGMTFLCGDSNNREFNNALFDYFLSDSRKQDEWLQAYPRGWDAVLKPLVDTGTAALNSRINYKLDVAKFRASCRPAGDLQIVSLPADELFQIGGKVVPKDFWKSPTQFANVAKAYTVMVDGKAASTAFASAVHDNKFEIGIETVEEYHGKGLAYFACAHLIEYCLGNNLEPVWSCRAENSASVALSKKLGFVETLRMPYYHIPRKIEDLIPVNLLDSH